LWSGSARSVNGREYFSLKRTCDASSSGLSDPLARTPAAEKLRERRRCEAIGRDRSEQREHRLALAQVDVRDLLHESCVPPAGGSLVLPGLFVRE
jgi:ribosomal protein S14